MNQDIDFWREHEGQLPPNTDPQDFAETGCASSGEDQMPSVWDLKRALSAEMDSLRVEAEKTPEFAAEIVHYGECLAGFGFPSISDPMSLERTALERGDPVTVASYGRAELGCNRHWVAANDAGVLMDSFVAKHADEISLHGARYVGWEERIKGDEKFRRFLAHDLWRATNQVELPRAD